MLHYLNTPLDELTRETAISRRAFLALSAGAAGGLLIGARIPGAIGEAQAAGGGLVQPFVKIGTDSTVTVIVKHLDKGQGPATGLATLIADELDASVEQMAVEFAPANTEVYKNLAFGVQGTGGSTAMPNSFDQYRQAGAVARRMVLEAAGEALSAAWSELTIENGVIRAPDGQTLSFGDVADAAATRAVPTDVAVKAPEDWVYIGKHFPRLDTGMKSTGAVGTYGMDVQMDNMLVAAVQRSPRFGGTVKSFDASAAEGMPGVAGVVLLPHGVAVLADTTWNAFQARDAITIEWDDSAAETRSTDTIMEEFRALTNKPGLPSVSRGDVAAGFQKATKVVEATFEFPYLAHTPMEPIDVTVLVEDDKATFWTGSQLQTLDQNVGATVLGLTPDKVFINTLWAGGSFGRRAIYDSHYVAEAAMIAKVWGKTQPIKVVWSREDDVKGGYYRPVHIHKVKAGIDDAGTITAWEHRIVGQSILKGTIFESFAVQDGIDNATVEGASDMPYTTEAMALDVHHPEVGVPTLWWRSVGHTHTAYVVESMMDELAEAAGEDPVAYRLARLPADAREAGVLRLAAEKAGWGEAPEGGISRGVAVHKSFGSYVAEIADVRMRDDGTVKVEKVVAGVDCGVPINPDNIRAQVEGGIGYGLSSILREEITLTDGVVDQSNFYDYLPMRISDMPVIDVHIVDSTVSPTGIGEPGTPPIGPAVANAVARATGRRVRTLPFSKHGLA